jgi:hypothetical protein
LQVGDTGPVESARRSNSRVLGSPFSGLSGQAVYWYFYATLNIFSYTRYNLETKSLDLHDKSLDLSNY